MRRCTLTVVYEDAQVDGENKTIRTKKKPKRPITIEDSFQAMSQVVPMTGIHYLGNYILLSPFLIWFCISGMTKIKMSKEESGSADFVERRRAALERYDAL